MTYHLLADLVVLVHFGFILFVVLGGLLAVRWPHLTWFHLPAVLWGALVEITGWICPLTPLENWLRFLSDSRVYAESFIAHYLWPVVYPQGLTRSIQILLGLAVLLINTTVYGFILHRHRRLRRESNAANQKPPPLDSGGSGS